MAIVYSPKVGEILECDFGDYQYLEEGTATNNKNYHGRIPPEMRKKRMVIVLNGKLNSASCLVVPISSTEDKSGVQRGIHVLLESKLFKVTSFYDLRDRWAKADTIQMVSKQRLFKIRDGGSVLDLFLPRDEVMKVQKAVIQSINASSLLTLTPTDKVANIKP